MQREAFGDQRFRCTARASLDAGLEPPAGWRRIPLYDAPHVQVERWLGPDGHGRIVKRVASAERVTRERVIHTTLAEAGLARGTLMAWRDADPGWLMYRDAGWVGMRWGEREAGRVIDEMVRIHRTHPAPILEALRTRGCPPRSHTPAYADVAAAAMDTEALAVLDRWEVRVGMRVGRFARGLWFRLKRDPIYPIRGLPEVLYHGDLHPGNVVWDPAGRCPVVIDWEFVHVRHAYFDLFQWLDVTSPTAPKVRVARRLWALARYRSRHPEAAPPTWRRNRWLRGYLAYAFVHLMWILQRMEEDLRSHRHPPDALARQARETLAGIGSIAAQWRRLGSEAGRPPRAGG
ncbi:phosphotransferase [Alicyclobacillus sp.]|uniref:phosphotransferase n=1 Tax=Alicyclobacillus sp. TaxID=61169 RepID=UPI0025BC08ED|nr:phosphotransferase [Alicyclobacillus sp.]MCL6516544.1 aminoglycoside phosphotransferase family protein [Alicyclobacillus sp.]